MYTNFDSLGPAKDTIEANLKLAIQDAFNNLVKAVKTVEQDSLSFFTSLMSLYLAINNLDVFLDKPVGADDRGSIFRDLINQLDNKSELTLKQKQRFEQLSEHTYSFLYHKTEEDYYKNDAVLNLLRAKGNETEESREYIYFLMHSLISNMPRFLEAFSGDDEFVRLLKDKIQEEKDHRMLEDLTRGIHTEIGRDAKSEFNQKNKGKTPQEITNKFKENVLIASEAIKMLQDIAYIFRICYFFGGEISLTDECYKNSKGESVTYQQALDENIKSILNNPLLLTKAMKICSELSDITGYKPQELEPHQKTIYKTFYAKAKVMDVINSIRSRLGGIFQHDKSQDEALTAAQIEVSDPKSVSQVIQAAKSLSDSYGRRGGIYTIPNLIWDFLAKFLPIETKSKTQNDLSTVIAELEQLKTDEKLSDEKEQSFSV